jgi:hypothetical protein
VGTVETAHFRSDDADVLVAASLACRRCLSGAVDWSLAGEGYDPSVRVRCSACQAERTVFLRPMQELRLFLQGERPLRSESRPGRSALDLR